MAKSLLLIDAESEASFLKHFFKYIGFSFTHKHDPDSGISTLKENPSIDIVLTEMIFSPNRGSSTDPRPLEGIAVLNKIKDYVQSQKRVLPVILYTTRPYAPGQSGIKPDLFDGFIQKPVDMHVLVTRVNESYKKFYSQK